MKTFWISLVAICFTFIAHAQKILISYDDIKYLLHNNLSQADTFLVAKGYVISKNDNKNKNREYTITLKQGTHTEISMRADGKRMFIEIATNEVDQYNIIRESIAQYLNKYAAAADVQTYTVKDLGDIYITVTDSVPYDVLRKDYDIHIVSDKRITAYN